MVSLAVPVTVVLAMVAMAARGLVGSDTWFHLSLGRGFLDGWSLQDPGRLTRFATTPWLPTQWSTEVLMAAFARWFGLPGVAWLAGAVYVAFVVVVHRLGRRHGHPLAAGVATLLVVTSALPVLSARPQALSLVLFALTLGAWSRAAQTARPPWWLVPLTWVWATAHGLWSLAVVLGVVVCLGFALDRRFAPRVLARMAAVPLLSVVAACATPVGPALVTSQLAVGERSSLIEEWGPTSLREYYAVAAALLVAVTLVLWSRAGRRVPWGQLLLVGLGAAWIVLVVRLVPFGAILVAPAFVTALSRLLPPAPERGRGERRTLLAVAAAALVALAILVPRTAAEPIEVPIRFAADLSALPPHTAILVDDGVGAWIEYQVPDVDPVIDGMLDAYPVSHIRRFQDFTALLPGWQRFVTDTGATVALTRAGRPVTGALQDQLGWRVRARDAGYVYLVAPPR